MACGLHERGELDGVRDRRDLAQQCVEAKAQMRPDAEEICRRSASSSSRGSSFASGGWARGRTATDVAPGTAATSSRSGFGSIGRAFSSGS
ncbi:hypothetical protein J4558_23255 [Leptolyngbya sp. 15MV]|nr:hypothetical protein J4558_23255 [Leptolyngbya sp. 15MV]